MCAWGLDPAATVTKIPATDDGATTMREREKNQPTAMTRIMCRDKDGKPPPLQAGQNIIYHEAKQDPATGRLVCVRCGEVM